MDNSNQNDQQQFDNDENMDAEADEHAAEPMVDDADDGGGAAIDVENVAAAPAADAEAQTDRNPEEAEEFYGFSERDNNLDSVANLAKIMLIWETKHTQPGFDPAPLIKKLAEIVEKEKEVYMRKDPDPFDDRHPYRVFYTCEFGFLLKQLFRKDLFMNKLVNDYMRDNYFTRQNVPKSSLELNILACRLILVIMPGLETSAVFQPEYDNLITRIYSWAEDSIEPLQSYATGLLASAMEVSEIAVLFREQNTRLIPKMLKRLHMLQAVYKFGRSMTPKSGQDVNISAWLNKPVTELKEKHNPTARSHQKIASKPTDVKVNADNAVNGTLDTHEVSPLESYVGTTNINILMENSMDSMSPASVGGNSSGAGTHKKNYIPIYPPTQESSQMLILRYLTSMGEYQEFLGLVIENYAMDVIFGYLDIIDRRDTCLVFEALKYLASLLCHKKFALDFISRGGLERLLKVPRPGIASTGVSIALYYLAYSEDGMERICTFPRPIVSELVDYVLWIVGHSYDSGRCHATMFFGLSFQFKVILEEFDAKDGLRKMYNVISVLKILNPPADGNSTLNEDEECACRQMVRHVCVALKRYMESHLFYKYHALMNDQYPNSSLYAVQPPKAMKSNMEQISEQIRTLQEHTNVRAAWAPVDQLIKLGGITLLLKIITFAYEWNNGGRSETLRSALDVLSICCVVPRVFNTYCERLSLPDDESTSGIFVILGAAAGDLASDADVQKSALAALCNCVCAPIYKKENSKMIKCFGSASKRQKLNNKYMEDLVEKVWESVCSNNGIIVLLSLMQTKVPITDADCIRGMACRALAGLARSERVRQIVGKLPLYTSGQIQALMRDPILQEKRAEHVVFQKYALELLQRVSGKLKPFNSQLDPSLVNIHKANVIAQTKIQYNEQQLYQLIHDHLVSKGMSQTAQTLRNEAGLQIQAPTTRNFHQSPFDYKVQPTGALVRQRLRSRMQDVTNAIMNDHETMPRTQCNGEETPTTISAPIKLVKSKQHLGSSSSLHLSANNANGSGGGAAGSLTPQTHRSLQKQISSLSELLHGGSTPSSEEHTAAPPSVTLNTIVTEYLTNQHALCKNPMTTCPQFDLLAPHKCPDPKPSRVLGPSVNMTSRLFQSQAGFNTSRLDRRYVHSNFAPWRTIRSNDYSELQFSCCDIVTAANSNQLIVGTSLGEAKVFNMNDGNEEFTHTCHSDCIDFIKSNRAGNLVLTSCSWRSPLSVLWSVANNDFSAKLDFQDDYYCEFSNLNQDKILGTQNDRAVVYDLVTGNVISTYTPQIANQYTKNRATFNPTDELILSDGVLWDVRSGRHIHKFDKLNQTLSGVFHTNGLEIISNTEVWDLRTFHLLQTVPVLNQCTLKFSPLNVLYGVSIDFESRIIFDETTNYETSFKVLDAFDYSSIATIDVKRHIYDLSVSRDGSLIALVENQLGFESKQETYVKIYTVGVKKNEQQDEVGVNTNATVVAANNEAVRNGGAGASMMRDASIAIGESHTRRRRRLIDAGDVIGERGVEAAAAAANAPAPAAAPPAAAVAGGGVGGGGDGDNGVGVGMDVGGYNLAAMDIVNDLILNGRPVRRDNNVVHRGVGRRRRVVTGEGGDLDIIWFPDGRNRLQVENRTRFSTRAAPTGAAAAAAAAGEGAANVARSPRRATLNHMLAAATSTYRRLARIRTARRVGRQRGPTVPARISGIGVVRPPRPRPRLAQNNNNNNNINNNNNNNNNNNTINGQANVAAATPAAAFANASNPVLLHHGVRRRRGGVDDIDFVMLEELDLLANNLISMLAGR